jgi:hypothetical protein
MDDPARRHQQIQAELSQTGLILPGSLTDRTTRCQRAGCHCHADPPQLHGPYPTWTRTPSHAPSREISPLSAGTAHRKPARTTGQRVLSVAHRVLAGQAAFSIF